jgi:hypothetical protein
MEETSFIGSATDLEPKRLRKTSLTVEYAFHNNEAKVSYEGERLKKFFFIMFKSFFSYCHEIV